MNNHSLAVDERAEQPRTFVQKVISRRSFSVAPVFSA